MGSSPRGHKRVGHNLVIKQQLQELAPMNSQRLRSPSFAICKLENQERWRYHAGQVEAQTTQAADF